jgi:hypothetical protein
MLGFITRQTETYHELDTGHTVPQGSENGLLTLGVLEGQITGIRPGGNWSS